MVSLLGGLFSAVKEVKRVVKSKKFQSSFRRGFLFSMGIMMFLLIKNRSVYAADQQPMVVEKRRTWMEAFLQSKYNVSVAGVTAGVVTAGVSGMIIYNLYNNNNVLKTTISQLTKNADILQLTIEKKTKLVNYLVEGFLTLEKTTKDLENRLAIAETARVFIS